MKKSEFREFVKEMFIDLIHNDDEVRDIVLEFVKENSGLLIESAKPAVPKEPTDPELYDKLILIASGQERRLIHEGKKVETPNYGAGFRSEKRIKEWANKAYSKIGGQWQEQISGVPNDTLSFLSAMGGSEGSDIRAVAGTSNDRLIKESIVKSGRGEMMALDENGNFDGEKTVDISSLLVDTAKTTLQNFPATHESGGTTAPGAGQEAFQGAPEQVFSESAGKWEALAFQGMDGSE